MATLTPQTIESAQPTFLHADGGALMEVLAMNAQKTDTPAARHGCSEVGQGATRRAPRRDPGLGARFALDRLPRDGKAGDGRILENEAKLCCD